MSPDEPQVVADLRRRAQRLQTPCGTGQLTWHVWGSGQIVVLLHGGYGSWTHWIRNIDFLAERYAVLVPDLPGMGESALPPEPYTAVSLAAILARGLEQLGAPSDTYDLVGFSFGAVLGGPLATVERARVRSFTIVGGSGLGPLRPPIPLRPWRHLQERCEREAVHHSNLAALMIADRARIDPLAVWLQTDNTSRARIKSRPIARTSVLADTLPGVLAPINAIYGERDATAYPHVAERRRQLRELRPDVVFRTIPDAGHWVQYEAASAFNEELFHLLTTRNSEDSR